MLTLIDRFGLLTLCGLGLSGLAAVPAHAQSLSLNGSATALISGSGTTTTGSSTFSGGANTTTISFFFVNAFDTSSVTVANGGSVTNLNGFDSSNIAVTGGSVSNLTAGGGSLSISGGNLGTVDARRASSLSVSGGSFGSLTTSIFNFPGTITGTISGGTFNVLNIDSTTQITGGDFGIINLNSPLNVFGTNLALNASDTLLTGTLQDGEAIDARVNGAFGFLSLNNVPVPEASTTVSFGLLMGLLGVMIVRPRRVREKKTAA